jgi:hypothetical protein
MNEVSDIFFEAAEAIGAVDDDDKDAIIGELLPAEVVSSPLIIAAPATNFEFDSDSIFVNSSIELISSRDIGRPIATPKSTAFLRIALLWEFVYICESKNWIVPSMRALSGSFPASLVFMLL